MYLRTLSPENQEGPDIRTVTFEMPDFYGSQEHALTATVKVYTNRHYTENELMAAFIDDGQVRDVYGFLTEDQKHDLRLLAHDELGISTN